MPRTYKIAEPKCLLSIEMQDETRDYEISQGPWTFRENLCFVVAGEEFDTKVPLRNVIEFSEKELS